MIREQDLQRPNISLRARILALSRFRNDMGVMFRPEDLPNIWEAYLVRQGHDECLIACLAMLGGVKLNTVKRQLKKVFGVTYRQVLNGWSRYGLTKGPPIPKQDIVNWFFNTYAPGLGDGPKVCGTRNSLYDRQVPTPHWTEMETGEGICFLVAEGSAHSVCFKEGRVFDPNWDFTWPVTTYFTTTLRDYFLKPAEVRTWIYKKS